MAHISIEITIDLGQKSYTDISLKKNCCDLNLGESLNIYLLSFSDSSVGFCRGSRVEGRGSRVEGRGSRVEGRGR